MNDTFCILPWMHLTVNIDGRIRICCKTHKKLDGLNFGYDKISDIFNGSEMDDTRNKMINGVKLSACKKCYFDESLGLESLRLHSNKVWKNIKSTTKPKIVFLDFKLSNKCNLICRMCHPAISSLHEKEYNISKKSNVHIPEFLSIKQVPPWSETDIFWENMKEVLPHLTKLKFTGGEPTIDENVHKILEYCIEKGYNKKIKLKLITNGTNLNYKIKNLISQFYKLNIDFSIEGIDSIGEYIRYPSNWKKINKTLLKVSQLENLSSLGITTVIQVLNIYSLVELFTWFAKLDHNIIYYPASDEYEGYHLWLNLLSTPNHYNINNLPNEILDKAITKLEQLPFNEIYNDQYIQIMNILKNIDRSNNNKTTDNFFILNDYYDLVRKQKLSKEYPELYEDLIKYKTK